MKPYAGSLENRSDLPSKRPLVVKLGSFTDFFFCFHLFYHYFQMHWDVTGNHLWGV